MAANRAVAPLTSSVVEMFRFASPSTASISQTCQHSLRRFSSLPSYQASAKRKMQTSTAYKPYSLDPHPPPPPRNAGIPDTSIAGSLQPNDIRPPASSPTFPPPAPQQPADEQSSVSVPEKEAQQSKPVASQPASQPAPKPRSKLRPRKAAMKLSPGAVEHLKTLLDEPNPRMIKVGVKNKGCSGLAYDLSFVEKPGTFDEMVEQDGVKVLIDSKALMSIIGSEMDWVEDKLNQRFVFRNPNIKEQCGCGESFMV